MFAIVRLKGLLNYLIIPLLKTFSCEFSVVVAERTLKSCIVRVTYVALANIGWIMEKRKNCEAI